jgi:cyclic-di-GMP phosphodiesterase TipF (flagellum assembly factor)
MIRISTIFIGVCMVLVAASLGMVLYAIAGVSGYESGIVALAALTVMILYNAVSMRIKDRNEAGGQITDLSRGTADLARQIAEFGRRLAVVESKIASGGASSQERIQSVVGEIGELGTLVKQLAVSVAHHEDLLTTATPAVAVSPAIAPPSPPAKTPVAVDTPPATDVAEDTVTPTAPAVVVRPKMAPAQDDARLASVVRDAIAQGRIDIYLQPMVTLPQRKVRFYEAMTRLRDDADQVFTAEEFIGPAESAGLMGQIDHAVLLRCMQVLRRLMVRNKDVGVFCNLAGATLSSAESFAECVDFLEANRALAPSFVLEFKQSVFRSLGPVESEHLAALAQRGYRFSIDHVTDLRMEPRELADRGVRFIKVPAALLLDPKNTSGSDIHPADLSDLLGRFGIDLVAERIESERAVVDLLDFDVRFGQGFLFAAPRPLRPETPVGNGSPNLPAKATVDPHGSAKNAVPSAPPRTEPPRTTGNAALARRATGPN